MKMAADKTDFEWLNIARKNSFGDGTTAVYACLVDNVLHIANVGDSRVVLGRNGRAIALSNDHKPGVPAEKERLEAAGAKVTNPIGNIWRINMDLSISRTIGDMKYKEPTKIVVPDPETRTEVLTPEDSVLIFATDGLWDVVSNQLAVDIALKHQSPSAAVEALLAEAKKLGTTDNATAVVVQFYWGVVPK